MNSQHGPVLDILLVGMLFGLYVLFLINKTIIRWPSKQVFARKCISKRLPTDSIWLINSIILEQLLFRIFFTLQKAFVAQV